MVSFILLPIKLVGSNFLVHSFVAIAGQQVMLPCKFHAY